MWKYRSMTKELIDLGDAYYSQKEYENCLRILFMINQLLGIFSSIKKFLKSLPAATSVLDVGCGSGLLILNLSCYFPNMQFAGIDTSYEAIRQAEKNLTPYHFDQKATVSFNHVKIDWEIKPNSVDIIMANLLCHHLTDEELIVFFQSSIVAAKTAVIIHDLHRSRLAYGLYKIISPFFRNRLITHDGLISIQRGFKAKELITLFKKAGIKNYHLSWRFPFCWRIIIWKN